MKTCSWKSPLVVKGWPECTYANGLPHGPQQTTDNAKPAGTVRGKPRTRHWAPKSKKGCITCRMRHVKCDEGKPFCSRCITARRQCDGYEEAPSSDLASSFVDTHQPWRAGQLRAIHAASQLVRDEPHTIVWPPGIEYDTTAIELFHYFRTDVVKQFAGAFDESFWTMSLLQATNIQPAVWHACNALAAIYRNYRLITDTRHRSKTGKFDPLTLVALQHYNKSVRYIMDIVEQPKLSLIDKEVLLVTNMLFTVLCRLRADFKEAHMHMHNGLQLIEQWGMCETMLSSDSQRTNSLLPINSLRLIFLRIYYQTTHTRNWSNPRWEREYCVGSILPVPFSTVTDAFLEQELIWHAIRVDKNLTLEALRSRQNFTSIGSMSAVSASYRLWKVKYTNFKRSPQFETASEIPILILDMREQLLDILSQADYSDVMSWDSFEENFKAILELATRLFYVDGTFNNGHPNLMNNRQRQFTITPSVIEPLYEVVRKSRNHELRSKALDLLSWRRVDEGMFGPEFMVFLGRDNMNVEERVWRDPTLAFETPGCECIVNEVICRLHRIADETLVFVNEFEFEHWKLTVTDVQLGLPGTVVMFNTMQMAQSLLQRK
ncbi:hypothetical protein VHEMI10681 [[Torrubiella] hemipterigena]|uniref:Zn(2)-C6 fungal-type domain-containing protein n=1 Tax=[Torrubiella] hemipterigena TaxID=1531966 RepID=A0A0A1TJE3_9HYPO|nr:hypothetical protein VHEMI10681 [[Torrubiella] hemipterigena]